MTVMAVVSPSPCMALAILYRAEQRTVPGKPRWIPAFAGKTSPVLYQVLEGEADVLLGEEGGGGG